jgi:hypothetical protein
MTENIYENVPPRRNRSLEPGKRDPALLPPVPLPKGIAGTIPATGALPPMPQAKNPMANNNLLDQRSRGVSVDRYREYQTPQYYEDTYYTREDNDHRVTVKHVDPQLQQQPINGRLERHSSHPNLRPRPATAGGRRLPKTPSQPPGTIIVIENVVGVGGVMAATGTGKGTTGTGRGRTLPDVKRAGSSAALDRSSRLRNDKDRRSYSLPRRPPNPKPLVREIPQGTGRRLPSTPQQSALPLQHAPTAGQRKRELPKPQSLELRHSNRDYMNSSNASLGLGGLMGRCSRSMNFPRLEGSPTHSECSSESGFLLARQRRTHMLRSSSANRRKLPDY